MMAKKGSKVISFMGVLALGVALGGQVSALSYQDEVDVRFAFNPAVAVQISGDLLIDDLVPGNSSDSNIVTVTAGTNDVNGYTLYTNVGNSSNNYTDLRISSEDSTHTFNALSAAVGNLDSFSPSEWGYSYCLDNCDTGSNWVYGSAGSTATGYSSLPLYNDNSHATDVMLADTNDAVSTTVKFKIGARADTSQASGAYTNVVNFIGIPKVVTTNYTINYNGNGATSGVPTTQAGVAAGSYVVISPDVPVKNNFEFLGWCDVATTNDSCSGTVAKPGRVYALNTTDTSVTKTMYAMWGAANSGQ